MSCTPSQQDVRIQSQLISNDADDPFLGSPIRMALDPRYADSFAINRHEPDEERELRKSILSRLRTALDEAGIAEARLADTKLPSPHDAITADDYLDEHARALAENRIKGFRALGEFMLVELLDGRVLVQQTNLTLEAPIEPLVICLDHTQYWKESAEVTEAGRIFTTYLTDASTGYHMCEIEPSYDLRHLYSTPEHDNDERSISEWVSENDDTTGTMLNVRFVERLSESRKLYRERTYIEADETYEQTMERIQNNLTANPVLQTPDARRDRQSAPSL